MSQLHFEDSSNASNLQRRPSAYKVGLSGEPYASCPVCHTTQLLDNMEHHMLSDDQEDVSSHLPPKLPTTATTSGAHSNVRRERRQAERGGHLPDRFTGRRKRRRSGSSAMGESVGSRIKEGLTHFRLCGIPETRHKSAGDKRKPGQRQGADQLGSHHDEERMPVWLEKLLRTKGQVEQGGVIPVLGGLLEQCEETEYAYLCHPGVSHISMLKWEGKFQSLLPDLLPYFTVEVN